MFIRLTIFCWILACLTGQSFACRYTVRDIGFAALRSHDYALVLSWSIANDDNRDSESAKTAEKWARDLKPLLSGSNVTVLIDPNRADKSNKIPSQGASLVLATNDKTPQSNSEIRVELVDTQGNSVSLPIPVETTAGTWDLAGWLNDHLFLPALKQISAESLESFAHLLVIEGDEVTEKSRVHHLADQALAAIQRLEPLLPRPISFPLRKMIVHADNSDQQMLLRRMMGCGDTKSPETLLAVIYGRGRLAGPVMRGDRLTMQEVLAQLALVGQSCECETDRAWLEEPSLPFQWDALIRGKASSLLGFDPDSPLVRAEMLRIVSQGPKTPTSNIREANSSSPDAIARMLLGYSETSLDSPRGLVGSSSEAPDHRGTPNPLVSSTTDRLGMPSGVHATVIAGDGWDFEPAVATPSESESNDTPSETRSNNLAAPDIQMQTEGSQAVSIVGQKTSESPSTLDDAYFQIGIPLTLMLTLATILGFSILVVFFIVLRTR